MKRCVACGDWAEVETETGLCLACLMALSEGHEAAARKKSAKATKEGSNYEQG